MIHPGIIYKITPAEDWKKAEELGVFTGAPIDVCDGFIHFSTASQARETAAKHFAGQEDLLLVAVETEKLGANLKWEKSRNDELFPHLYSVLPMSAILWAKAITVAPDGSHKLPLDGSQTDV